MVDILYLDTNILRFSKIVNMVIPKIIHYCWFGTKPLPESAQKCILSWKKYFPDYEIREWNEHNFNVKMIPYTTEAYRLKKYAFVSDYARFWILYNYGGIYFDTDVEVVRSFNDILDRGAFMGSQDPKENESDLEPASGLGLGIEAGNFLIKEILEWYESHHFANFRAKARPNVVHIVTALFKKHTITNLGSNNYSVDNKIIVYASEYFCPINYRTGKMTITDKTHSIHHFAATWVDNRKKGLFLELWNRIKWISVLILSYCKM